MKTLLRWLIFTGHAPDRPWFRKLATRRLVSYTIHGDTVVNLGSNATVQDVAAFRKWWRE